MSRFSEAISEGDGISVIPVLEGDVETLAAIAEEAGAEGVAVRVADVERGVYTGMLDSLAIHHRALSADEVLARVSRPDEKPEGAVLFCSFDNGDARDDLI